MKTHFIKFLLIASILSTSLLSCDSEKIDPDKYVLPLHIQASHIADQIQLNWYSPLARYNYSTSIYIPNAVSADKYELFVSTNDTLNFSKMDEIDFELFEYTYSENIPGKRYFLKVKSSAKGAFPTYSNMIWIMGGINPEIEMIVNSQENNSLQFGDISPDNRNLLYSIDDHNTIQLISFDIRTGNSQVLTEEAEHASYASGRDLIAFISNFGMTATPQPTNMGIIAQSNLEITQITSSNNVIQFPDWSPDDLSIFYLNVHQNFSNPWQLEQYQLQDGNSKVLIKANDLIITDRPISAKNSPDKIFLTAYNNEDSEGIYEFNIVNKDISEIEQSKWSDHSPALSPNGKYLAFISDRSGREEIWVKEMESNNYSQQTADFEGYPQGKLAWGNDNKKIYFKGYYQDTNGIFTVIFEP